MESDIDCDLIFVIYIILNFLLYFPLFLFSYCIECVFVVFFCMITSMGFRILSVIERNEHYIFYVCLVNRECMTTSRAVFFFHFGFVSYISS